METHIGLFKLIFDCIELACEYTSHTPFTQCEKVLKLLDSLDDNDANLTASLAQICADLPGKGSDFQACCSLLTPADPVEKRITKTGSKRGFNAMVSSTLLSGRGSTGVDLHWYPNKEFKALSTEQRRELAEWRQTPEGVEAMEAAKEKRKKENEIRKKRKANAGGGDNGKGNGIDQKDKKKWKKM